MFKAPHRIGRYEVVKRIGQGGMGILYLATDPVMDRPVVVKLLRVNHEELHQRFLREGITAGRLQHPNVVSIFDVGEHQGQPFIAMECIVGETLEQLIEGGSQLALERKLELITHLCAGLAYAHRAGVVHRDIKPANLMVDQEGHLKILDFGIARVADSRMTRTGVLMGTPNYMAPEQHEGRHVDHRSDIFSVGLVIYELLSYAQAFPGDLMHVIASNILHGEPRPLVELCPDIDPALNRIVERAIRKRPEARYQDLNELRADIVRVAGRCRGIAAADRLSPVSASGPPVRTLRRGMDRDLLEQRRDSRVEQHLQEAQRAFDAGDPQGALAAGEQAALLDPDDRRVLHVIEAAKIALDERQIGIWLAEASDCLARGALDGAAHVIAEAEKLDPMAPEVVLARRQFETAREEQRRQLEQQRGVQVAWTRAHTHMQRGELEDALAAAMEVLRLEPAHTQAQQVRERAFELLQQRKQDEQERKARAAHAEWVGRELASASAAIARGAYEAALATLERLRERGASEQQVDVLLEAARAGQQEAETVLRRQRDIAARLSEASEHFKQQQHARALERIEAALALDPAHLTALGLRSEVHEAIARSERDALQLEADRRADAAILRARRAFEAGDHPGAITELESYTPRHERVLEVLTGLRGERDRIELARRELEAREHRRRALAGHIDRGRAALRERDLVVARAAVDAALIIDRHAADVRALDEQLRRALAAQRVAAVWERLALFRERLRRPVAGVPMWLLTTLPGLAVVALIIVPRVIGPPTLQGVIATETPPAGTAGAKSDQGARPPAIAPRAQPETVPTDATAPALDTRVAQIGRDASGLMAAGQLEAAATRVEEGLGLAPADRALLSLRERVAGMAAAKATLARNRAVASSADSQSSFRDASRREREASQLQAEGRVRDAVLFYVTAADLYARAQRAAETQVAASPSSDRPKTPAGGPTHVPPTGASNPTTTPTTSSPSNAAGPTTTAPTPSPPPEGKPVAPVPAATSEGDRAGVQAALQQYAAAFSRLDLPALLKVYPELPDPRKRQLQRSKNACRSYSVEVGRIKFLELTTDTATVQTTTQYDCVPKTAQPMLRAPADDVFVLKKRPGGAWLIDRMGLLEGPP